MTAIRNANLSPPRPSLRGLLVRTEKSSIDYDHKVVVHLRKLCGHEDCVEHFDKHRDLLFECVVTNEPFASMCGIERRTRIYLGEITADEKLRYGEARVCFRCASRAAHDLLYRRFTLPPKRGRHKRVRFFAIEGST